MDLNNSINDKKIVLFDGYCGLCNASVQFLLKQDKKNNFLFATQQSPMGLNLTKHYNVSGQIGKTFVLIDSNKAYTQSTAGLRVFKYLPALWPILYSLILIPKFIRDAVYTIISKNRYNWFGKRDHCRLPTKEEKNKFL